MFKRNSTTTDEPPVKALDLLGEFKRIAEEQPAVLEAIFRVTIQA